MNSEQLVCIKKDGWKYSLDGEPGTGPKYGDIVTPVDGFQSEGVEYVILAEWPGDSFIAKWFVPLDDIDISDLTEINEMEEVL